jgi:DNA-binding NarL/FixJ family response regulator
MESRVVKVFVVDDHQLFVDGIKLILKGEEDFVFAGGASNIAEAMAFIEKNPVDVVISDIYLAGESGIDLSRMIKKHNPEIKVLALSMHDDYEIISRMIEAGASGYLLKSSNMNEMLDAVRVLSSDKNYLGREIQAIMMANLGNTVTPWEPEFTPLEMDIIRHVALELTDEEISQKLKVHQSTIETIRKKIFAKTRTKSVIGLIRYAVRNRLIR